MDTTDRTAANANVEDAGVNDAGSSDIDEVVIKSNRIFPQRLSDNYKTFSNLVKGIKKTNMPINDIVEQLEFLLNDSMPQTEYEHQQHMQEQLHYHRDPTGYYEHLNNSKLRFLILWTDYKAITNHFRIRKLVHIRWTGTHYECQVYDTTKRVKAQARRNEQYINEQDIDGAINVGTNNSANNRGRRFNNLRVATSRGLSANAAAQ
jgi:hypothetical protein